MDEKGNNLIKLTYSSFWIVVYISIFILTVFITALTMFIFSYPHHGFIDFLRNLISKDFETFFVEQYVNIQFFSIILSSLCYLIIFKLKKTNIIDVFYTKKISLQKLLLALIIGVLTHFLVQFAFVFFYNILESAYIESYQTYMESYQPFEKSVVGLAILFILSPIFEEVLFRGLIGQKLKPHFSFKIYIFLQALIFSLIHSHPLQILYTFLLGIVLGLIYEKHKNIFSPIMLHIGFNLPNAIVMLR